MKEFKELPQDIQDRITALAESMGVKASDTYSLLNLTIDGMEADKVADCLPDLNASDRNYICETYMLDGVKRFKQFAENIQTNDTLREGFSAMVYEKLTANA